MDSEQTQSFNERLNQWVASQGFWFQLRHSLATGGARGNAVFHLFRLGFRLLLFVLLLAGASWVYLVKRTDARAFREGLESSLAAGLGASEPKIEGFKQSQGELAIAVFSCEGGPGTFFNALEARNIKCRMGVLDRVVGEWDPGTLHVSRLEMDLRAGGDDAASSAAIAETFFKEYDEFKLSSIEVRDTTLSWGLSDRTRGRIDGSLLKGMRTADGWRLQFTGGRFSQNWLRRLEIVNLVVVCTPEGLVFENAKFRSGRGSVDFSGLKIAAGIQPGLSGNLKMRNLPLEVILPVAARQFIEGSVSGDLRVSGSTNSAEGVGYEGEVRLDGEDLISVRERLHLLRALSVIDAYNNYRRVDFREGAFSLKTTGGVMEIARLNLKADDLLTVEGNMRVRPPTPEEARASLGSPPKADLAPIFGSVGDDESEVIEEEEFTLRRAAVGSRKKQNDASLMDRLGLSIEARLMTEQAAERLARRLRYEGMLRITLRADAFERAEELRNMFPVDPEIGRIPMDVPLEGSLYEITLKQAEEVYERGRR